MRRSGIAASSSAYPTSEEYPDRTIRPEDRDREEFLQHIQERLAEKLENGHPPEVRPLDLEF
jgi:hypothetical protein